MMNAFVDVAAFVSRSPALSIVLKATVALLVGLAVAHAARRARASVRHLVLASTFAALLALPPAAVAIPELAIEIPVAGPPSSSAPGATPSEAASAARSDVAITSPAGDAGPRRSNVASLLWAGWATGAGLLFASLALALHRLGRIRRFAEPWLDARLLVETLARESGVRRPVEALLHAEVAAPFTCGFSRPAIVLPSDARAWSDADLRRALVHELEHVRRGDWTVQLLARATCALYWFHPIVWTAWRRLCLEAERACDDAVVRAAEGTEYAEQLVSLARRLTDGPAPVGLAMASRSDLAARVHALLDGRQRRGRAGYVSTAVALAAAALVVVAIAPVHAVLSPVTAVVSPPADADAIVEAGQFRGGSFNRALYRASERGDVARITELLDAGADVNAAIDGDGSPLIGAAREGRIAAVRLLLDRGADPNMPVPGDGNPLIAAAAGGYAPIVDLLLQRGARIDEVVPGDENALIQASGEGHLEVVTLLVARGANVNTQVWVEQAFQRPDGEWRTPLSMAVRGGRVAVTNFLRSMGAR